MLGKCPSKLGLPNWHGGCREVGPFFNQSETVLKQFQQWDAENPPTVPIAQLSCSPDEFLQFVRTAGDARSSTFRARDTDVASRSDMSDPSSCLPETAILPVWCRQLLVFFAPVCQ